MLSGLKWMWNETQSHYQIKFVILPPCSFFCSLLSIGKIKLHEFTERKIIAIVGLHEEGIYLSFMDGTNISSSQLLMFSSFEITGPCLGVAIKLKLL